MRNVAQSFVIMVIVLSAIRVNIVMVVIEMTNSTGDNIAHLVLSEFQRATNP